MVFASDRKGETILRLTIKSMVCVYAMQIVLGEPNKKGYKN